MFRLHFKLFEKDLVLINFLFKHTVLLGKLSYPLTFQHLRLHKVCQLHLHKVCGKQQTIIVTIFIISNEPIPLAIRLR